MRALAVVLALAATAHANTWKTASDRGAEGKQDAYDAAMRAGDEAEIAGKTRGASLSTVLKYVGIAEKAYREAAAAKPDAPEPWYRLGEMIDTYFFDCERLNAMFDIWRSPLCDQGSDPRRRQEVIDAWNEFEKRAPLDPRLSPLFGSSRVLFERAIQNTKLVDGHDPKKDRVHLEAAARDYEAILARSAVSDAEDAQEPVISNLAETYMMLDRVDEAVDKYVEALKRGASSGTQLGLAVALDRDDRGEEALEQVRALGPDSMRRFEESVQMGSTFFVPDGEHYYYFGLIAEAFGQTEDAIDEWRAYIRSGAHAEFQPRAQQHLDELLKKRVKHPQPRPPLFDELP